VWEEDVEELLFLAVMATGERRPPLGKKTCGRGSETVR